jgi:hypothetical protein
LDYFQHGKDLPPTDEFRQIFYEHPESWSRAYLAKMGIDHPDLLEAKVIDTIYNNADDRF